MKIIELLIRIANKEEIPKKIKYSDKIWELEEHNGDYKNEDTYLFEYLFKHFNTKFFINNKVEIIEEPKKIEKIEMYQDEEGHYFLNKQDRKVYVNCDEIDFMVDKFNELIDEVNKTKEEKK